MSWGLAGTEVVEENKSMRMTACLLICFRMPGGCAMLFRSHHGVLTAAFIVHMRFSLWSFLWFRDESMLRFFPTC